MIKEITAYIVGKCGSILADSEARKFLKIYFFINNGVEWNYIQYFRIFRLATGSNGNKYLDVRGPLYSAVSF